jgi:glutamate---cysteine ligase / carboxylate-amine ligase
MADRLGSDAPPEWPRAAAQTAADIRAVFDAASELTVGVEEELTLVDPQTLAQAPAVDRVLELAAGDPRYVRELKNTQIELVTPVAGNALAAALLVARARSEFADRLAGELDAIASGTYPGSGTSGEVVAGKRYEQIADEYVSAAAQSLPCGQHVHVAVPGADRALAVYNAARSFLPELGALAANSPFLDGEDTGLASSRRSLNDAFHRTGVPPAFASWDEFAAYVAWGREGGLFPDATHFWWELRPHVGFGTLEFRVADTQTRLEDSFAVAACCQALVAWLAERYDSGEPLPSHETFRVEENAWRAMRYGVRGWMVDLETGEPTPARDHITALLDAIAPSARRLGVEAGVLTARALLVDNGAERQRAVAAVHGVDGLIRWLARETVASAEDFLMQRA